MMDEGNLAELPEGWMWIKLENCVDILDSQRIPVSAGERIKRIENKPKRELYPYYGATAQVGWIDGYLFDEELVLLGEDGAPFFDSMKNKAYTINGKSWVNNHAHVLRAIRGLTINQFLCNYLNIFDYNGYITGTTRPKLNQKVMRKIPIPLPPLPEQQRIVTKIEELFTNLDAGIKALKTVRTELKRYRQAILKYAFEGKLTREWRELHKKELEPASVLLKSVLEDRREKWKTEQLNKLKAKGKHSSDTRWMSKYKDPILPNTNDLPRLPMKWHWATGDAIFWFVTSGSRGWAKYYADAGALFIRMGNLNHVSIALDLSHTQRVQPPQRVEGTRSRVIAGDILISITADVGMIALVPKGIEKAYINQHIALARPVSPINAPYVAWFLSSQEGGQKQFLDLQRGATKVGLGLDDIRAVNIPLPPLFEQQKIIEEIEQRFSIADEIEKTVDINLKKAERLRQSILKKAFEGKLVSQYPNDEPAHLLLERIKAEKNKKDQRKLKKKKRKPKKKEKYSQKRLIDYGT
jgi:type I restriction enzyme S subunit